MPLKPVDEVLQTDPRFASDMMLSGNEWRSVELEDHHALVQAIELRSNVPADVREAFDRARNVLLYAWFCYELLIVAEMQAFAAMELGLRTRLRLHGWNKKSSGLRGLTEVARQLGLMPPTTAPPPGMFEEMESLAHLRNDLAHGTGSLHSPAMAILVLERCASVINSLYSAA